MTIAARRRWQELYGVSKESTPDGNYDPQEQVKRSEVVKKEG